MQSFKGGENLLRVLCIETLAVIGYGYNVLIVLLAGLYRYTRRFDGAEFDGVRDQILKHEFQLDTIGVYGRQRATRYFRPAFRNFAAEDGQGDVETLPQWHGNVILRAARLGVT